MASQTIHVVQSFNEHEGLIVPAEPRSCPSASYARFLVSQLAATSIGVIAWSRTGDPDLGDWQPAVILSRVGTIPEEFEQGGGVQ